MADKDSHFDMAPPPQPVKKLGLGVRAVLQIVFAILSLVFIYYLAFTYQTRKDLSERSDFTVSEATENLLRSSGVMDREEPIKIIAALRKSSPHYSRLRPVVDEYERLSKGKVKLEYLDPIRDKDRAFEIQNNYGDLLADKLFEDDIFIIDARKGASANSVEATEDVTSHLRYLPASSMVISRTDINNQRRIVGYQDEDLLSSMLQSAIEGKPRIMYLVEDKSDLEVTAAGSPLQVISEALQKQNIYLLPLKISQVDRIPENAEGLVIVAPEYDFEPKEIEVLESYWRRPSSAIIAYLNPTTRPVNLKAFLRKNGVTPRDDRIIRTRNGRTENQVLATFTVGAGLGVNGSLEMKSVPFEGRVGSLEVREGAEDLVANRIQAYSLIETAPDFWGETDYKKANPKYDDDSDYSGPLSIGAAVIRGNANSDNTAPNISKMIVLSTSDFLDPARLGNEQLDFVKNSTYWLLGREELMGIGPRSLQRRKLNLIKDDIKFLSNIVLFFIPVGLFLVAMFVWNIRRA
ncbi:GldG family protein [Akkermansiaceae bacterium]|nr:GldG family protein [Akkermansiaceae bacterium]MDB4628594.1 GldG family protein [Akkermansiaceae bacterium]MDB4686850.1 GldG family protein [Akkermansiaceae bacterium]